MLHFIDKDLAIHFFIENIYGILAYLIAQEPSLKKIKSSFSRCL